MEFADVVQQRCSIKTYDAEHELSDDDLKRLFDLTIRAPSSFNLQHWRFIVLRDPELRRQVEGAAWGQKQITEASVTVVIVGKLAAHDDAARIYAETPEDVQAKLVPMIGGFYATNDQLQRDEAIRSGSLASMAMILWSSSPWSTSSRSPSTLTARISPILNGLEPISITSSGSLSPNAPPTFSSPLTLGSSHVWGRQP